VQYVTVSAGGCTATYQPIGAANKTRLKLNVKAAYAPETFAVPVQMAGEGTRIDVPQWVDFEEVVDSGNAWELTVDSALSLGIRGTTYSAIWTSSSTVEFTCTDGSIRLSYLGNPTDFEVPSEERGIIPAGWGVEVATTGEVIEGPYLLDDPGTGSTGGAGGSGGSGGTGGEGGAGGSGGDGGSGGTGDTGGTGGSTGGSGGNSGTGGSGNSGGTGGTGGDVGTGGTAGNGTGASAGSDTGGDANTGSTGANDDRSDTSSGGCSVNPTRGTNESSLSRLGEFLAVAATAMLVRRRRQKVEKQAA